MSPQPSAIPAPSAVGLSPAAALAVGPPAPPAAGLRSHLLSALRAPERLVDPAGPVSPQRVLAGLALGGVGALVFALVPALGPAGLSDADAWAPSVVALPPLLFALSFPPLVLGAALQGRPPGLRALAALAMAGPATAGLCWLALSPMLLLYALSTTEASTLGLLHAAAGLFGAAMGVAGAVRTAEAAGDAAPGRWVVRGHAVFTLWTAAVLAQALL